MRRVDFTDEEILWINQMLDVALKQIGRQCIPAFVAIVNKLAAAREAETDKAAQ